MFFCVSFGCIVEQPHPGSTRLSSAQQKHRNLHPWFAQKISRLNLALLITLEDCVQNTRDIFRIPLMTSVRFWRSETPPHVRKTLAFLLASDPLPQNAYKHYSLPPGNSTVRVWWTNRKISEIGRVSRKMTPILRSVRGRVFGTLFSGKFPKYISPKTKKVCFPRFWFFFWHFAPNTSETDSF